MSMVSSLGTLSLKTFAVASGAILTIGHIEPISSNPHCSRGCIEPPDLLRQPWGRPEILNVSIGRVRKVNLAAMGVDGGIVERVELAAEEVIQDHCRYCSVNASLTPTKAGLSPVVLYGGSGFMRYMAGAIFSP